MALTQQHGTAEMATNDTKMAVKTATWGGVDGLIFIHFVMNYCQWKREVTCCETQFIND